MDRNGDWEAGAATPWGVQERSSGSGGESSISSDPTPLWSSPQPGAPYLLSSPRSAASAIRGGLPRGKRRESWLGMPGEPLFLRAWSWRTSTDRQWVLSGGGEGEARCQRQAPLSLLRQREGGGQPGPRMPCLGNPSCSGGSAGTRGRGRLLRARRTETAGQVPPSAVSHPAGGLGPQLERSPFLAPFL